MRSVPGSQDPFTDIESAAVRTAMRKVQASVARFSRNDAEDIVQEAMTRAIRHGVECDAEPWLKVVARRIATDNARRAHEVATGSEALDHASRSRSSSPEDIVVANDSAEIIRSAVTALPKRYRDALITYAERQDNTDVATYFGISSNAGWSLLCRARARLRQELDRVGYAFGAIGVRLHRWTGEVATAGTVACLAFTTVLVSTPPPAVEHIAAGPRSSAVVSVTLPHVATTPAAIAAPAKTKVLPAVKKTVEKMVEQTEIVHYAVRACGLDGTPLPLGAKVTVLDDARKSIVGTLLSRLPERVKTLDRVTC